MSSSDDDFEKEMEMELDANMLLHEKQFRTDGELMKRGRKREGKEKEPKNKVTGEKDTSNENKRTGN